MCSQVQPGLTSVAKAFRNYWTVWKLVQMRKMRVLRTMMMVVEGELRNLHLGRISEGLRNYRLVVLGKLNQAERFRSS